MKNEQWLTLTTLSAHRAGTMALHDSYSPSVVTSDVPTRCKQVEQRPGRPALICTIACLLGFHAMIYEHSSFVKIPNQVIIVSQSIVVFIIIGTTPVCKCWKIQVSL